MNVKSLFVLLALGCLVFAQSREDKISIDPFTPDTPSLIIAIGATLPETKAASVSGSGIIGGERDLALTAESGPLQRVLTAGVSAGECDISTPNGASGFTVLQYDGADNSPTLVPGGLGGIDFTVGDGFRCEISSDIATEYTFTIYSSGGASSSRVIQIPGDSTSRDYIILFSDFTGNANFGAVGAVEVLIEGFDNVDTTIKLFQVTGPVTPGASASPSPNPPGVSGFTWYTPDDDFGRDPCDPIPPRRDYYVDNDNVVYYYFYGYQDDDFDPNVYFASDSLNSPANILVPSIVSMLALIAVFF